MKRITPACAGISLYVNRNINRRGDHPRVRGDKFLCTKP